MSGGALSPQENPTVSTQLCSTETLGFLRDLVICSFLLVLFKGFPGEPVLPPYLYKYSLKINPEVKYSFG